MSIDFNKSLSNTLAHSIVLFLKEELSPNGVVDDARNDGDPTPNNAGVSMADTANAYKKYLPSIMQAMNNQAMPTAQAQWEVNKAISPQEAELNAQLYSKYAPIFNQVGQQMSSANQAAQSQSDLNVARGSGKALVDATVANQRAVDPEYFKFKEQLSSGMSNLLSSLGNPNELSGGERAEIERSLNRSNIGAGNGTNNSAIGTVKNAMTFGSALGQKQQNQASMFGGLSQAGQGLKSGVDAFAVSNGKQSQNQYGAGNVPGVGNYGQTGVGLASGIFNTTADSTAQFNELNANRRDSLDRVNQAWGTGKPNCCFIFLEAYKGTMPESVRFCRDYFYAKEPRIVRGYKNMANWLVPLMRDSEVVRFLVWHLMIKPLTKYGEYLVGNTTKGKYLKPFQSFWFTLWKHI